LSMLGLIAQVNTVLLVLVLVVALTLALWAVARDIRKRMWESPLNGRCFWRREVLSLLRGFLYLVVLVVARVVWNWVPH